MVRDHEGHEVHWVPVLYVGGKRQAILETLEEGNVVVVENRFGEEGFVYSEMIWVGWVVSVESSLVCMLMHGGSLVLALIGRRE